MKKNLIPALLILALLGGCKSKDSSNGTADTTTASGGSKLPPGTSTGVGGQPTATLMPPSVMGGQAGPITISAPANTRVLISAMFLGTDQTQKLTIWDSTSGVSGNSVLDTLSFSSNWASFLTPNNATASQTFTINASLDSAPYPNVGSSPIASGQNVVGFDITTYSGNPPQKGQQLNKSVIAIVDLCGQF